MVAVGIDLGTSLARVAVFRGKEPELVPFADGAQSTPAVVSFAGGTARVGRTALAKATTHPADTVRGIKRLLGRELDDPVVRHLAERAPFAIEAGPNGGLLLKVGKEPQAPEDVAALLLASLVEAVERAVGERPEAAVFTTPYWFGPRQRAGLAAAAKKAGIYPRQIVSEATATALSLLDGQAERNVAIVDVGAGGVTVSILEVGPLRVRLLATAGDPLGGGDDVDAKLVRSVLRGLRGKLGDFPDSPWVTEMLRQSCEAMKRELVHTASASTVLPFLPIGAGVNNQRISIERETADAVLRDSLSRIARACADALSGSLLQKGSLASVHVTGGLTRMTSVRAAIERALGPISSRKIDPDGAVALGAAHQSAMLDGLADSIAVIDVQASESVRPPPMSGRPTAAPVRIHTPAPVRLSTPAPARPASPPPASTPAPTPAPAATRTPKPASVPPEPSPPRATPVPVSARAAGGAVDASEFRSELATLLAALRAGAVTDASSHDTGRKLVARANDIEPDDPGLSPDERSRTADRLAGLWNLFALVLQAARQYRWDHPQTERQLDRAFEELVALLSVAPRSVVVDVGTTQLTHHGFRVWKPDRPPLDRVPYELFVDGVRRAQLKAGVTRDELRDFLGVLTRDPALGFGADDDAATALFSRNLPHVGWFVVDAFADGDDPEFERVRDDLARELADLASAEGASVLGAYAEARRKVAETTSRMALDDATRAGLLAALSLAPEAWRDRFAKAFAALDEEAERSGQADALQGTLSAWAEEQVKAHAVRPVLELFGALHAACGGAADGATSLQLRIAEALLPPARVRALVEELEGEQAPLGEASLVALDRILALRSADEGVVAVSIKAFPLVHEGVREALLERVLVPAAGAVDLAPLLPIATAPHAARLLRAVRAAGGSSLAATFAFAFRSPHLDVRLDALSLLPDPPPDHVREDVRKLVEDRDRETRLRVLRVVIDRKIGAAGDALARRLRERGFHDLDEVERALLLEALGAGDRRRAEALALELLEQQGLFRGEAVEQSRALAADFLAGSESLEVLDALQRVTKRWFTSSGLRDSATRAADNVARRRATPRPTKA